MSWTLERGPEPARDGESWAVEIQPRFKKVVLAARTRGHGTHDVGMRVSFQRYGEPLPHADERFSAAETQALLVRIDEGYSLAVLWSGDAIGEWTEDAWEAAIALSEAVTRPT